MKKSPSTSESDDEARRKRLLRFHISLTILWILGAVLLFVLYGSKDIQLNELGDYVAGVASPAAFYWLIVGFFLQRTELELQRDELEMARTEFTRQASALEETNDLHQKTLKQNELERIHRELRETLSTVPNRIERILDLFGARQQPRSSVDGSLIPFPCHFNGNYDPVNFIAELDVAAELWDDKKHGSLIKCFNNNVDAEPHKLGEDGFALLTWYKKHSKRAHETNAEFFFEECNRLNLLSLLEGLNRILEPDIDWNLIRKQ